MITGDGAIVLLSHDLKEERWMSGGTAGKAVRKPNSKKEEPATAEQDAKPKSKMTWKERLAQLPEEEAAALRAKAAEASRRSKAKKSGTRPEQAAVDRLEARLAKNEERRKLLESERQALAAQLEEAMAALAGEEAGNDQA